MSGATIGPVLPVMSEVFADTPNAAFLTRLILTMPALFIVLSSTACGYLTDRYGRKKMLFIAVLVYGLSGSAGMWLNSLTALLVSRAILGVSVAAVMTVCITLIGDYYQGNERQRFMGLQAAFMAFGGVVFITTGGILADISWRAPFMIYAFALVLLPAIAILIREPVINRSTIPGRNNDHSVTTSASTLFLIIGAAFFGMAMFYMIPVHIPFLLSEFEGMNSTRIGLALSSFVFMGALVSLQYHRFLKRMSYSAIYLLCFFLLGTGYILISCSESYPEIFTGMIIGGIGSGLLMPNSNIWLLSEAPERLRGRFSGMLTTAVFLGQFLSPILTRPLMNTFSIPTGFLIVGCIVALSTISLTAVSLLTVRKARL